MNTKEIQALRRKFIGVAMLSFAIVIALIGTLINVVNYSVTQREIQYSLTEISQRQDAVESDNQHSDDYSKLPSVKKTFSPSYQRNPFYIISYDKNLNETSFHASKGNTYPEDDIRESAESIMQSPSNQGRYSMYYYQKEVKDDGTTTLVLLDSSYVIFSRARILYATIAVGIVGLLATLVLVILLSRRMIQPEIENNKRQLQFITNVSHELKTPLAVIRSNAEMEEISNGESEWTQSTIRQVDRMNGLIKSLVMITKTREKEEKKALSDINISSVVSQTVKEFSAIAESENKTLTQSVEPDLLIRGDESKLRQLTMILIDNAVKYCDPDGEIGVILEKTRHGKRNVKLTVKNSYADGNEIDCKRFFDRFYREDSSRNIDTGGYGIGLSIAQSICEQYNGNIYAEWENGTIQFVCEI